MDICTFCTANHLSLNIEFVEGDFRAAIESDGSEKIPLDGRDINHAYTMRFFKVVIDDRPATHFVGTGNDPKGALRALARVISTKTMVLLEEKRTRVPGAPKELEKTIVRTEVKIPNLTYETTA